MVEHSPKILASEEKAIVILNVDQGHPNWYEHVKIDRGYHYEKFFFEDLALSIGEIALRRGEAHMDFLELVDAILNRNELEWR